MRLPLLALTPALLFAACAGSLPAGEARDTPAPVKEDAAPAARGLAFAQSRCSGCHGVSRGQLSPNPESPPFETVANMPGLTATTLNEWLRESHNFPETMNFSIAADQVDDLAAYILTLRDGG